MSLRAFHLLFIGLSVALLMFFAAWAAGQYQVERAIGYLVTTGMSLTAGGGLAAYGEAFRRKTRNL